MAYYLDTDESTSLCLIRSTGGRATKVLTGPRYADFPDKEQRSPKGELWSLGIGSIVWSPDGKRIAIEAERYSWDHDRETTKDSILLLAANGEFVRATAM